MWISCDVQLSDVDDVGEFDVDDVAVWLVVEFYCVTLRSILKTQLYVAILDGF